MASGWANDDAVNEQINSTIEDAIARARGEIPRGESLIDMGRTIWHPVGLMMTPSTNRSTVQLKMRLPALGVKFRVAKACMNVKSAVPLSRGGRYGIRLG